jgi:hypothetical protein
MPFRPIPVVPNLDRLKSTLLTSGLQQTNNPLFQLISQLIDYLRKLQQVTDAAIASSGGGGAVNGGFSPEPLTDGDIVNPELIFADGDVIVVETF